MSSSNETITKTLTVVISLCLVCAVIVSSAAVMLKPAQKINKAADMQRNILLAAGLLSEGENAAAKFKEVVDVKLLDLNTGKFATDRKAADFDYRAAPRDKEISIALDAKDDIVKIKRRSNIAPVYLAKDNGKLSSVILPVYGAGLWGPMYGFIAIDPDATTVKGIKFYEHKETPGLGAEIENPKWVASWVGKKLFNDKGEIAITVQKGGVTANDPQKMYKVDGLSGATLTSNGVQFIFTFWLGEQGFGPFLQSVRNGELTHG
ncbi:Na(+)-translocating NADH-quinone reductase subunit C [Algicola sagamiensis]|uniref:Na(+)-translocating NADH-quinone reductase subunit C n=1 Tax=Algicola sagamiensis TaxID=163869 RepID=UPI000377C6B4|nr:Na(+)-translocating NADH-quinone reductase subunit C [Algicola sagamiensis]